MTDPQIPLLCLPHAGAGASFFWRWRKLMPAGLRLCPLQLPGREERIEEEPWTDVHTAVEGLLPDALNAARDAPAVAVFGHSLGAVLAYELARALAGAGVTVAELFVSGSPAPSAGRSQRATGIPDDEFIDRVEEFAGDSHPALRMPELRELLLPVLRSDVAMHEDYRPRSGEALPAPITCLRGDSDQLVTQSDALAWSLATEVGFRYYEFPGGHMYLTDSAPQVVDVVSAVLGADALPLR
ncbi:thioesterase II family protein [Streptomyces sp. NPDC001761]